MFHDKIKVILEFCNSRFPKDIGGKFNLRFAGMVSGVGVPAKRNLEVSNQSFQRCKFNGICHQDSLPTNASFTHIHLHPKQGQPLIPCHLHHSTQPTPRHPMIQTMIHHQMIPLVMKMMMKCWWNRINKNHKQQNCCHAMRRIISTLPWVGRTYKFFLPWPLVALPMIFPTTRMYHFQRQRHTILK